MLTFPYFMYLYSTTTILFQYNRPCPLSITPHSFRWLCWRRILFAEFINFWCCTQKQWFLTWRRERDSNWALKPLILFTILNHFFAVTHTVTHISTAIHHLWNNKVITDVLILETLLLKNLLITLTINGDL